MKFIRLGYFFGGLLLGTMIVSWYGYMFGGTAVPLVTRATLNQDVLNKEKELIAADIDALGAAEAYRTFKDRQQGRAEEKQHEFAHTFGEMLYKKVGTPGVAVCDADFAFGCYHSFFGFALMENGLDIIYELEEACVAAYGLRGLGCQHGIGHGVLAEVGYENVSEALQVCGQLAWKGPIGGCSSGVFMEYNFATMQGGITRPVTNGDLYYPCTTVEDVFKPACYFELPQWWIALTTTEDPQTKVTSEPKFELAANYCEAVTDEGWRTDCYRGLGNLIAGRMEYSVNEIRLQCELAPTDTGDTNCLQGAAWFLRYKPEYENAWQVLCSGQTGEAYTICVGDKEFIES